MIRVILILMALFCRPLGADLLKDFDSLGGNQDLIKKAEILRPETRVEVVQNRIVNRKWRHELAPEYASVVGGDVYLKTQNYSLNYHLHFGPKFSLGLKYGVARNRMSSEGDQYIKDVGGIPELDWPEDYYAGTLNWYPIYGKFSFLNLGIVHFDVYALAGYGEIKLRRGDADLLLAGGGVGFWWSQHLTTRFEIRYHGYESQRLTGDTDMELTLLSLSLGYML